MRKLRRNRRVHGQATNAPVFHAPQQFFQAIKVHRLGEHVLHYFLDQRMVRNLNVAGNVLLARGHVGKD